MGTDSPAPKVQPFIIINSIEEAPGAQYTHKHHYSYLAILKIAVEFISKWCLFVAFVGLLVFTIMWDLKRVQILSDVIHDDHANYWVDLDASSLSDWFTPFDLCMLRFKDENITTYNEIRRNCSDSLEKTSINKYEHFCSIGTSLGRNCDGPFEKRSYFKKRLHDDNLGDPQSGTLNRALYRIASRNRTVIFIGDGISRQNQWALICEMMRIANVTVEGDFYGSRLRIIWNKLNLKIDIHFIYVRSLKTFSIKSNTSLQDKVNVIYKQYNGAVFIANVGAWYNSRDKYRDDIAPFLQWLSKYGEHNLIFFRETAAQHWNHTNNGYFARDGSAHDGECVALADSTPHKDWRNHDVKQYIRNEQLDAYFHLIPFRDITSPLHDMHPSGAEGKDCTHYCYFPQLWQPVWNELDVQTFNYTRQF